MAFLEIHHGRRTLVLHEAEVVRSRRGVTWIRLPVRGLVTYGRAAGVGRGDAHVQVDDDRLEPIQAAITADPDRWVVVDYRTPGGSYCRRGDDVQLVTPLRPYVLRDGDIVCMGAPVGGIAAVLRLELPADDVLPAAERVAYLRIDHRGREVVVHGAQVVRVGDDATWIRLPRRLTFGRGSVFGDADAHVQLDDDRVARIQAAITVDDRGCALADLGSCGGTLFRRGDALQLVNMSEPQPLQDGDIVCMGRRVAAVLRFALPADD